MNQMVIDNNLFSKKSVVNGNNFVSRIVIMFILLFFVFFFLPIEKMFQKNILIGIEFSIIFVLSIANILIELSKRRYSLNLIHWLYVFLFLGCAGVSQFSNDSFLWNLKPELSQVFNANLLVIFWCIVYCITHYFVKYKKSITYKKRNETSVSDNIEPNKKIIIFCYVVLLILLVLSIYSLATIDIKILFAREKYNQYSIIGSLNVSSSIKLLFNSLIRGACLWVSMVFLSAFKKHKRFGTFLPFLISLFCCLILVPPFGVARYVFAATYGAMILFYFDFLKRNNFFIYFFVLGILFVFPMLNAFRGYTSLVSLSILKDSIGNIINNFTKADYDSYSMLIYTIKYCDTYSLTFGKQLLSTLLFFVPSNIWEGKSGGSGSIIIESFDNTIPSNVSCPLIGEGFINFGIVGVFLFCVLLAIVVKIVDERFWTDSDRSIWMSMFYSFFVLFLIFILRGDLLSSFAFFMGYATTFLLFFFISRKGTNNTLV